MAKSPGNAAIANDPVAPPKIQRAILALRLLKAGGVSIGDIFDSRRSRFLKTGLTGSRPVSGETVVHLFHEPYSLEASDVPIFVSIYESLRRFEGVATSQWRHVGVALRAFSAMYGRVLGRQDDQIIDAATALEAMLNQNNQHEITFTLAFRGSGLIADRDDERVELFSAIKRYYGIRSRIVHGDDAPYLEETTEPFAQIIRRLLKIFIVLATPDRPKKAFYESLDTTLLHSSRRQELRDEIANIQSAL